MIQARYFRRILVALTMTLLLVPVPTVAGPAPIDSRALLRLAVLTDAIYDEQPSWLEESELLPDLPLLVKQIAAYIEDEGYGSGHIPAQVTRAADFGKQRSLATGRYFPGTDTIELNERFLTDPSWADRPWLGVLVHEMVHGEGYSVESQVQLVSLEILATMANDGYPGAMLELTDRIRRQALLTAWWMSAYEHVSLPRKLASRNRFSYCSMGCPVVRGDASEVREARSLIFDERELRRVNARERYWLKRSQRDYDVVLGSYVAEPLAVMLAAACGNGLEVQLNRSPRSAPIFPSVDDMRAFLIELQWCQ